MAANVLYLVIRLGADRYLIDTTCVIEVLPLVRLKTIPGAPRGTAGLMSFRGAAIPVVDLGDIAFGEATQSRLMTRIVVVRCGESESEGDQGTIGLLVPEVLQTVHHDPSRFERPALTMAHAPYLGQVLTTSDGILQQVRVSALLSDELRTALFRREIAA